jgi:hypothetical protein
MKKWMLLVGALLCGAVAYARPQFLEPTRELRANIGLAQADVDGDWILARGFYRTNIDPNDPDWTFDIWEKIVLFHRASSGEWQIVQTLADEYLIFNSDEHFPDPHDLVLENGVAAFSTNSGLHIFELVAGTWVSRSIVGASQRSPVNLDFDGITLLASDGSCSTAATAFTRQTDGRWVAQGELIGHGECEEYFQRELAVSGSRALVFEDGPWQPPDLENDRVRVFERSGGAWLPGATLPPPPPSTSPFAGQLFGPSLALRGDVALVGGDGTHVYRRGASGFTHAGKIPILVYALDRPYANDLEIGPQFALQTYPGPSTANDVAVLQPNSGGGFDHVATLGEQFGQYSLNISGRRVVTSNGSSVLVYDLPTTFTPTTATLHDFENGTQGWTTLAGQFAVAQRGSTRVYRQSSLTGDSVAVNSADLKATLITADVRPTAFDGDTRWVGLMARYIDENNMYYLTIRGDSSVRIRKKVNGVITELRAYQPWPPVPLGTNYRVSFEVVGNRLAYYRNGERVIDAYDPDNSLPHGRAGVRTYRATADFDNVIITPAPLMELGGGPRYSHISFFDIVDGSWTTSGIFDLEQSTASGNARILHGHPTDDQAVKVTVRINGIGTDTSGSHWAGAMVRYTDPSNYYYVTLRTSNEMSLRKVVNGVVTELDREAVPLQVGTPYRLRVEAIGTQLIVYLNDQVRLQASDSSHTQGRSGLVTYRAATSFRGYSAWQP